MAETEEEGKGGERGLERREKRGKEGGGKVNK